MSIQDAVFTRADGRRIGYRVRGRPGGHPVVYFHGQPGSRLEVDLLDDAAVERADIRLVAFDRPGMGASDLIPARDMTLDVEDAVDIADHLGIRRFTVMGVSAGGAPAMAITATHAERVAATVLLSATGPYDDEAYMTAEDIEEVRRVHTVGAAAMIEDYEGAAARMRVDTAAALAEWFADFPAEERAWAAGPTAGPGLVADFQAAVVQGGRGWLRETEVRAMPWSFDLAGIRTPVRAFHGSDDGWECLSNIERVLAQVHDGHLTVYPGGNHLSPFLHQDEVLASVRP